MIDRPSPSTPWPSNDGTPPLPDREAVAWQARDKIRGGIWQHCDFPHSNPDYEYRPLYASAPPESGDVRADLETIARTTFSGSEMGDEYMRGNRDAHATCANIARRALLKMKLPDASNPGNQRAVRDSGASE